MDRRNTEEVLECNNDLRLLSSRTFQSPSMGLDDLENDGTPCALRCARFSLTKDNIYFVLRCSKLQFFHTPSGLKSLGRRTTCPRGPIDFEATVGTEAGAPKMPGSGANVVVEECMRDVWSSSIVTRKVS